MIGLTKLLCGTATVSEVMTHAERERAPARMLQFMKDRGPIVVWNVTRRCNLACEHCYYPRESQTAGEELTRDEGMRLIGDLKAAKVPVLLFSGGEPLLREDVYPWAEAAAEAGLRPSLSTNGTLIDDRTAARIASAGFAYVGVSLDGTRATHDAFRGEAGAFDRAVAGLRAAKRAGLRTGVRFTVCADNLDDLPIVLDLVESEGIPRFCLYHLVCSGRAAAMRERDLSTGERRAMIDCLIERTLDWHRRGIEAEILTVDNHADGVRVLQHVETHQAERVDEVKRLLELHGGCSAGTKFGSIDAEGNVHPCQFWEHVTLGNVKTCTFAEIWNDLFHPLLRALKVKGPHLTGERCGKCDYRDICAGCRVRAEADTGSPWADDPSCYLSDRETHRGS